MSPLAHIRQVAACSVFVFFAALALGADAPTRTTLVPPSPSLQANLMAQPPAGAAHFVLANAMAQPAAGVNHSVPADAPTQSAASSAVAQAVPTGTPAQAAPTSAAAAPSAAAQPTQANTPAQPVQLTLNTPAQIAHSPLLSVAGTARADTLQLRIQRSTDKSLVSSDDVTVMVDGKNETVTRGSDGSYELAINNLRGASPRDVDIVIAHDGIREILSGKISVAEASSADGLLGNHKQIAWWILNIVIVLIAAIAISRRKG